MANGVLIDSARNLHGLCRVRADSCGCPRGSANPAKNPPRIFYSRRVLVDSINFFLRNQCGIPESTKLRGGVCFAESADFCGRPQELLKFKMYPYLGHSLFMALKRSAVLFPVSTKFISLSSINVERPFLQILVVLGPAE